MATVRGILGQTAPAAATASALYTVPTSKSSTVRIVAANRSGATTIRIWVQVDGATLDDKQYLSYDEAIAANESASTVPFMFNAADALYVRSASGSVSFTCTGIEQDD